MQPVDIHSRARTILPDLTATSSLESIHSFPLYSIHDTEKNKLNNGLRCASCAERLSDERVKVSEVGERSQGKMINLSMRLDSVNKMFVMFVKPICEKRSARDGDPVPWQAARDFICQPEMSKLRTIL